LMDSIEVSVRSAFLRTDPRDGITKPKGLFAYAGQSITAVGALTLAKLLDAEALALGANVNTDALKWVMTSREFIALRKIKAGTGLNNLASIHR